VQGKLVSQDKNAEPASELLKKIKVEKVKDKKYKELPAIKSEEIPFEIPDNWTWCKLGDIAIDVSTGPFGTMLHKSDYVQNQIPLVNPMNIVNEKIVPSHKMTVDQTTIKRLKNYVLNAGDIVISRRGEMGRCAAVTENEKGWLCGTGSFFIRLYPSINREYFVKVIGSTYSKNYLLGSSVGSTMNNLNHKILNSLLIPVPPIAVQQGIVSKLKELVQICDELDASIQASKGQNEQLLQQVLREALKG
jgi:type I restriction enzyme S subunit